MSNLTVWCVCIGEKYDSGYVYALKEMVGKYLTIPHHFKCITKRKLEGITTVLPPVPYQGWWGKMGLFAPLVATGPSLYFDLDVVLTKNIDYLADYTEETFAAPENWARSGHGGIQSSVMAWSGNWNEPYNRIKPLWPGTPTSDGYLILGGKRFWGDQEFLWDMLGDYWTRIPGIGSYKYHCQAEIPNWLKVCVFHGEPKPIEVHDPWISSFIAPLRRYINVNTHGGSQKDLSATV